MGICTRSTTAIVALSLIATVGAAAHKPDTVEIRVRVLHARSGKPWQGLEVTLYGQTGQGPRPNLRAGGVVFKLRASTDSDGVAVFQVRQPLPPALFTDYWPAGAER
jgi:hypothetical protein